MSRRPALGDHVCPPKPASGETKQHAPEKGAPGARGPEKDEPEEASTGESGSQKPMVQVDSAYTCLYRPELQKARDLTLEAMYRYVKDNKRSHDSLTEEVGRLTTEVFRARKHYQFQARKNKNWFRSRGGLVLALGASILLLGVLLGVLLNEWWIVPRLENDRTTQVGRRFIDVYGQLERPQRARLAYVFNQVLRDNYDKANRLTQDLEDLSAPKEGDWKEELNKFHEKYRREEKARLELEAAEHRKRYRNRKTTRKRRR